MIYAIAAIAVAAAQTPAPRSGFEAGVAIGAAALSRDTVPQSAGLAFSTNSPSFQSGLAIKGHAVFWDHAFGVRAEVVLWQGTDGETMSGLFAGPLLRFGGRNPVMLELAAGWVGLPLSQVYYPLPEEDDIWWSNPMRSHHGTLAYRAGLVHERVLNPRMALRLGASWATATKTAQIRTARYGPPASATLDYEYFAADVGLVWSLTKRP
jgi:hypothetical protein